jgi:hypothetical protein
MGFLDWIFGGKPNAWTDSQYSSFKDAYGEISSGHFSWLDALPPTNLPSAGTKMASLPVKVMVDRGEMGKYASAVVTLHEDLRGGFKVASIKDVWIVKLDGKFLEKDCEKCFYTICALHLRTYGTLDVK